MHLFGLLSLTHVVRNFSAGRSHLFLQHGAPLGRVPSYGPLCVSYGVPAISLVLSARHLVPDWNKREPRQRPGLETLSMFLAKQLPHVAAIVLAVAHCCELPAAPTAMRLLRRLVIPLEGAVMATALLVAAFATAPLIHYLQMVVTGKQGKERDPFRR